MAILQVSYSDYYGCLPRKLKKKNRTLLVIKDMKETVRFCEKCKRQITTFLFRNR